MSLLENSKVESGKHIVIIDDDGDIQDLIVGFFKPRGYRITTFDDAESAYEAFENQLVCDVIITDLQMPKMSGLDLTKKLKALNVEAPIIVMTVTKSTEVAIRAIQQGAYDFLVKPIHFPQLQISVERALQLKNLKEDYQSLRSIVKDQETQSAPGIIGRSPGFLAALDVSRRVAKSTANIFIFGESGTGKEVIAKFVHSESNRKRGPFVAINCAAIPENLLESELFGHAKGAFTGAIAKKIGLFEEAENGTLFLDEIGDLSMSLQAKLLRVLQEKKIKRVGENQARPINARIISATHKTLHEEVAAGRFREDLYFRLNVIPIRVPALRDRKEDVVPLSEHFLKRFASINDSPARAFSKEALQYLMDRPWKGNVRELENAIERSVVLCGTDTIQKEDLQIDRQGPTSFSAPQQTAVKSETEGFPMTGDGQLMTLHELTQQYIEYALIRNGGAKDKTARDLGIDRKTLYRRIQGNEAAVSASAQEH
ncbi:acetoacetate metabolism transcriptional regulator AtoC [soil metagenome]